MKNKSIFLFIFLLSISLSHLLGQSNSEAVAIYTYHNIGLDQHYTIDHYFNKQEALSEFTIVAAPGDSTFVDDEGAINLNISLEDSLGKQVFQHAKSRQITFRDIVYTNSTSIPVIVTENIPTYAWELKSDTMKINNLNCKRADVSFRGRSYVVWYTTEIATPFGPWKFHGLPGLIVQAYTDDHQIQFLLNQVKPCTTKIIQKPRSGKEISFEEYVQYRENAVAEFIKKIKTKLPRGAKITINSQNNYNIEKVFE